MFRTMVIAAAAAATLAAGAANANPYGWNNGWGGYQADPWWGYGQHHNPHQMHGKHRMPSYPLEAGQNSTLMAIGDWKVKKLATGKGKIGKPAAEASVTFTKDGSMSVGSCNTTSGGFALHDSRLQVSLGGGTKIACPEDGASTDAALNQALGHAVMVSFEGDYYYGARKINVYDVFGNTLMILKRAKKK